MVRFLRGVDDLILCFQCSVMFHAGEFYTCSCTFTEYSKI